MTVRILTAAQKEAVVTIYTSNVRPSSIQHLAAVLQVSTRTISRVIEEAGHTASKKAHTASEGTALVQLLYKHKMTFQQLETLLDIVKVKPLVQAALQVEPTRKSPSGHVGKQNLLPLNFPPSLELH